MRIFLTVILTLLCYITTSAQQKIEIIDDGSKNESGDYTQKEINGEMRSSALVIIQSTVKLNYTVMGIAIAEEDLKHSINRDGIYVDTIYFYVNDFDSRRRLMIYAEGYPSEEISLNMIPNNSYSYMVIGPNVIDEPVEEEEVDVDKLITQAKLALEQFNYEYAELLYTKILKSKESDDIYANLANSQYQQANINKESLYDKAIVNADKALALNPNNYLANLICGLSHAKKATRLSFNTKMQINENTKAVELLFRAIEIDPNNFTEYELTGDTYDQLFKKVTLIDIQTNTNNIELSNYYTTLVSEDMLIIRYKNFKLEELNPTLYKYGNNRMICYQRAIKQKATPGLYFKLGNAYVALDKFDEAIECFIKSITDANNKGKYRIDAINKRITK